MERLALALAMGTDEVVQVAWEVDKQSLEHIRERTPLHDTADRRSTNGTHRMSCNNLHRCCEHHMGWTRSCLHDD